MKKLIGAFLVIMLLSGCSNPQKDQYNQAMEYMEKLEYTKAMEAFKELGDYKDSQEMLLEATYQDGLVKLGINKNYKTAVKRFEACGDYKDAADKCIEAKLAYIKEEFGKVSAESYVSNKSDVMLYLKELMEAGNQEAIDIYENGTQYVIEASNRQAFSFAVKSKIPVTIDDVSYVIKPDDGGIVTGYLGTMTTGEPVQISEVSKPNNSETVLVIGNSTWYILPVPAICEFYDGDGNLIYSYHRENP